MSTMEKQQSECLDETEPKDTRDELADGLMDLLKPIILELDSRVKATRQSQLHLRTHIDSLAEDLRIISDQYQAPYDMESYVRKLQDSKKRVAVVSSILQNATDRLNKLQTNLAKETSRRKALLEQPTPQPPT